MLSLREATESVGKIAVIDSNPRRGEKQEFDPPKRLRFKNRTEAERVNSNLKDDYGGRYVRVRGAQKVMSHLMFGILALTAMKLVSQGGCGTFDSSRSEVIGMIAEGVTSAAMP